MTRRVVIAAAVLGTLALAGCTEIGAVGQQTAIDVALSGLEASLESDYGVTAVTSKQMDAEYRFSAAVTIDPAEVDATNRRGVIAEVDRTLAGSAFDNATTRFAIGDEEDAVYSQYVFGLDSLQSDLDYWAEVESLVGAVAFHLNEDPDGDGPHTRTRTVYSDTPIDFGALRDIELDDTALDTWGSPGLGASGSLPTTEAAAVLTVLTAVIPPQDYNLEQPISLAFDWSGEPAVANWYLSSASLEYDLSDTGSLAATDPAASADWPRAVQMATLVAGAGIHGSHFAYFGPDNGGGVVWFGECSTELAANVIDTSLFAALQTAGVVMPAGSAPGWCSGG